MGTERNTQTDLRTGGEHILACLSPAPSNARIIRTAARMAQAFRGTFTALYVRTPEAARLPEDDLARLHEHIRLAEQLGADISIVEGEDVTEQIGEFARVSGITTIVLGRSRLRHGFRSGPLLSERIQEIVPELDVHIIPDPAAEDGEGYRRLLPAPLLSGPSDLLIMGLILSLVTAAGTVFLNFGFTVYNIVPVYLLGVLLVSLFTRGYLCSVLSAVLSVVLFNYFLTEPRYTFHAYASGYPVTFAIMLATSVITGTLASKLKDQVKISAQSAYRTKVLHETDRLLRHAEGEGEILRVTAGQLLKLLGCGIAAYPEADGSLGPGVYYPSDGSAPEEAPVSGAEVREAALWVLQNREPAGFSTKRFPECGFLFFPIRIRSRVCGVIGIERRRASADLPQDSMIRSILGECALAIENDRNHKEKEEAAIRARNEQLRADLLRTISHDLRTPLTSISGNADYLRKSRQTLDEETIRQVYTDIYEDAQWLISLVENLLSISRISDGQMQLRTSPQPVAEVIEEALQHVHDRGGPHILSADTGQEILITRMDAKLIMQVIINLVDNAVKYTPAGSRILVRARREDPPSPEGRRIVISVEDNGPGVPDAEKPYIFEMFYTGRTGIADSRRSLGLGLSLCRSIVEAHGGGITLADNKPHGSVFSFTLPAEEVQLHE